MSSRLRMNRITSLFSFFTGATNTEHKNFEPEVRKGRHMIIYKETYLTVLVTRLGVDMLYCDYLPRRHGLEFHPRGTQFI